MREVIAVCRSSGKSRKRVERALDRYLFRVGDRTWRGRASNACLERIAKDLKRHATRSTAVAIHGFQASRDERLLFRVGAASKFGQDGLAPIATSKAAARRSQAMSRGPAANLRAITRIAAMFHDIGKATRLFQSKLRDAILGKDTSADALRHELISALAWDELTRGRSETELLDFLQRVSAADIDRAMLGAADLGAGIFLRAKAQGNEAEIHFDFLTGPPTAFGVGILILGHHRLPMLNLCSTRPVSSTHCNIHAEFDRDMLLVAEGAPFWTDEWLKRLCAEAALIRDAARCLPLLDTHARTALMLADHLGSSQKKQGDGSGHLANTMRRPDWKAGDRPVAADGLARHTSRVTHAVRGAFDALVTSATSYPSIAKADMPTAILNLDMTGPFAWQGLAAARAAELAASGEGGFFGCLLAGTGTGKTRGAPGILAAVTLADPDQGRRGVRFTLGLGLRTLAHQSGEEYVEDLGFFRNSVRIMTGQAPIHFPDRDDDAERLGSADMIASLAAQEIERVRPRVPEFGSDAETDWLRGLTFDPTIQPPAFIGLMADADGRNGEKLRALAASPIICATVDHIIAAASPERSRHLPASVRVLTSDLILDEIDQYGAEDVSVVARLAYLTGAAGRRLIIMSATLTRDLAMALHDAYRAGWSAHASCFDRQDRVHVLCVSDAPGAISGGSEPSSFATSFDQVRALTLEALEAAAPRRIVEILPDAAPSAIPEAVSRTISRMHDRHHARIDGFRVSFGFVGITRINHVAGLAVALPQVGADRLRRLIVLHSRFTRLGRSWIEAQLRAALTRKGDTPDAGLARLCGEERLFEQARSSGVQDIEIVLICSPVIETGNDLDFDYAILDYASARSVVQAAGRVLRHRRITPSAPNVALLARPLVTMDGSGRLEMPGVETTPAAQTGLDRISARTYGISGRSTRELLGLECGQTLSAALISQDQGPALAQAEAANVRRHLDAEPCRLGDWIGQPLRRHAIRQSRMRKFRRNSMFELLYWQEGDLEDGLQSYCDRDPGGREFHPELARDVSPAPDVPDALYADPARRAWLALHGGSEVIVSRRSGTDLLAISMPVADATTAHDLLYSDHLGLFPRKAIGYFGST
ncbi:HD domain-containing protein [Paracoccus sp. ME4]|uniref:HD domain-containing protein n=1 Tax=Paracoccus sp. ME4 TaxID=3138066 RepID=UPI00398B6788